MLEFYPQTARDEYNILQENEVAISMDGRGRAFDNIFTERLWRSLKYEEVYLKVYQSSREARQGINKWFTSYNYIRPHQALDYQTPAEVYFGEPLIDIKTI